MPKLLRAPSCPRRVAAVLFALAAAIAASPDLQAAEPMLGIMGRAQEGSSAPEPADEILAAAVYEMKSTTTTLRVDAAARTSRPGQANGVLIPHIRIAPAADGIYEITFYTFPARTGGQDPARIEVLNFWKTYPADLKGVRIYGATNCIEAFIHQKYATLASGRCTVAQ